ncbi:hypothetical protein EVAR_101719_1, partial [Eumeta japonica]
MPLEFIELVAPFPPPEGEKSFFLCDHLSAGYRLQYQNQDCFPNTLKIPSIRTAVFESTDELSSISEMSAAYRHAKRQ